MSIPADPPGRHRAVTAGFTARVTHTSDWDAPAPVAGWRARDVVAHLVEWFPDFLKDATGLALERGPSPEEDPVEAWQVHSDAVQRLLDGPAAATPFRHPMVGEMPLPDAVDRFYTTDVFLHTWDLARATGQDERLDPQTCADLLAGMAPIEELLRSSGQYGPRVPVPDGADVQTRLLGFIGRDPQAGGTRLIREIPQGVYGSAGMDAHSLPQSTLTRQAVSATLHCLTGCAIGEILGLVLSTWWGWGNGLSIALAIVLAFVFGYSLTMTPVLRAGLSVRQAVGIALAADTLSIVTMEIMDNAVVLAVPGAMNAGLADLLFWASLAASLAVAFSVTVPVNRALLARGKGHAVVHAYHH